MMAYVTVVIGVGDYTVYLQNYTEYDEHYNETTSVDPLYYTVAVDALKATQHRVNHAKHSQHSLLVVSHAKLAATVASPARVQHFGHLANGQVDKAYVQVEPNQWRQQHDLHQNVGRSQCFVWR
jgi:hypothetical protein